MKKIITIIVPLFNSKEYVQHLLVSLTKQNYKQFEVIFVDDASIDCTQDYIVSWLNNKEINYKYIYLPENKGPGIARNEALKKAEGDFVLFIDSDDWIREDTLSLLIENINNNDSDLLIFDYYRTWNNGSIKACKEINFGSEIIDKDLYAALTNDGVTRKLFKKEIIMNYNIQFPSWYNGEDIAFVIMYTSYIKNIRYIQENFYYYLQRDNSISNEIINDKEFYIELYKLYNTYHKKTEFNDYRVIQDLFYNQILLYLKCGEGNKEIKAYLSYLTRTYPNILSRISLNYFDKAKQIFIIFVVKEKLWLLRAMYFIKKNIVK